MKNKSHVSGNHRETAPGLARIEIPTAALPKALAAAVEADELRRARYREAAAKRRELASMARNGFADNATRVQASRARNAQIAAELAAAKETTRLYAGSGVTGMEVASFLGIVHPKENALTIVTAMVPDYAAAEFPEKGPCAAMRMVKLVPEWVNVDENERYVVVMVVKAVTGSLYYQIAEVGDKGRVQYARAASLRPPMVKWAYNKSHLERLTAFSGAEWRSRCMAPFRANEILAIAAESAMMEDIKADFKEFARRRMPEQFLDGLEEITFSCFEREEVTETEPDTMEAMAPKAETPTEAPTPAPAVEATPVVEAAPATPEPAPEPAAAPTIAEPATMAEMAPAPEPEKVEETPAEAVGLNSMADALKGVTIK